MRSFVKMKSSRNAEITLSFTSIRNSWPSRDFLASQICLLTLYAKNKILVKIAGFTVSYGNNVLFYLGFVARNPVFGASDMFMLKPAYSATESG